MNTDAEIKLKDLQSKLEQVETVMPLPFSQQMRESFPLYKIFGEQGDYHPKEKSLLIKWLKLSADIETILKSIKQLNNDSVISDLYKNYADIKSRIELASGTSITLANVTSAKPTGFIHQDIKKFYEFFNNSGYASKDKKKENTADAVLLYNCSISEIQIALKDKKDIYLPKIAKFDGFAGETTGGIPIAAGAGDNAAAGFGIGAKSGDLIISLGTSGTAFFVSETPSNDPMGEVAGFADLTGRYLPLVCTLNAARVLDAVSKLLGKSHDEIGQLALKAKPGAEGLTMLGYFEGERTPNRPDAKGLLAGINNHNLTAENISRCAIESILCGLIDSFASLQSSGAKIERVMIVGGAAKNPGVGPIASAILGREVMTFPPREFVADGAARQAAWALSGELPNWQIPDVITTSEKHSEFVLDQHRNLKSRSEAIDTVKWN